MARRVATGTTGGRRPRRPTAKTGLPACGARSARGVVKRRISLRGGSPDLLFPMNIDCPPQRKQAVKRNSVPGESSVSLKRLATSWNNATSRERFPSASRVLLPSFQSGCFPTSTCEFFPSADLETRQLVRVEDIEINWTGWIGLHKREGAAPVAGAPTASVLAAGLLGGQVWSHSSRRFLGKWAQIVTSSLLPWQGPRQRVCMYGNSQQILIPQILRSPPGKALSL